MSERAPSIVVVDDNEEQASTLWRLLTMHGFIVHEITSDLKVEAVTERIQKLDPDLVITDLMWSRDDDSGKELFEQLTIPVILASSDLDRLDDIQNEGLPENKRIFDLGKGTEKLLEVIENLLKRNNQ